MYIDFLARLWYKYIVLSRHEHLISEPVRMNRQNTWCLPAPTLVADSGSSVEMTVIALLGRTIVDYLLVPHGKSLNEWCLARGLSVYFFDILAR